MLIRNDRIHDLIDNYIRMAQMTDSRCQIEDMQDIKEYILELEHKLLLVSIKEQLK